MKTGDLVRYKDRGHVSKCKNNIFVVRRVELKNQWLFLYNYEIPFQISLFEVLSESR